MPTISQFQRAVANAEQSNGYVSVNKQGNIVVKGTGFGGTIASWFRTNKSIKDNDVRVMRSFVQTLAKNYGKDVLNKGFFKSFKMAPLSQHYIKNIVEFADIRQLNVRKIRLATDISLKNSLLNESFDRIVNGAQLPITLGRLQATPQGKASIDVLIQSIKQELTSECSRPNAVLSSEKIHSISENLITQFLKDPATQKNIQEINTLIANNKSHAIEKYADQIAVDATQKASILSRLEKIRDKRELLINQPITVNDIHARSAYEALPKGINGKNLGEFSYINAPAGDTVSRINQHIENLARTANAWHEQNNFADDNGAKVLKDEAKNNITRLCTDEFAFWPKGGPLKNDDFLKIISHIEETAKNQQENLTLILASFPVEGADGKVHNTVVHVQCGATPKINVFAKTTKSGVDADYSKQKTPTNQAPTADIYEPSSPSELDRGVPSYFYDDKKKAPALMPFMDNNGNGFVISRDNVVHVKTAGGAQCFDVVDICLDHMAGTGERNLTAELNEKAQNMGLDLMPNQVSQVISSASIQKSVGPNVSSIVLHADPLKGAVREDQSLTTNTLQDKDLLPFSAIFGANNTNIKSGQLQVQNTAFGPPLEIEFYKPYALEKADHRVDKALLQSA